MAGNSFGKLFKLTTFGESHGVAIGGIIDGCPSGLKIDLETIQNELNRRKPGQSKIVTQYTLITHSYFFITHPNLNKINIIIFKNISAKCTKSRIKLETF